MKLIEVIETETSPAPDTVRFGIVVNWVQKTPSGAEGVMMDVMHVDTFREALGGNLELLNTIREEVCVNRNKVLCQSGRTEYTIRKANSYDVAAAFDIDTTILIEEGHFPAMNSGGNIKNRVHRDKPATWEHFRSPIDGIGPRPANYAHFKELLSPEYNPLNLNTGDIS